MRTTSVLSLEAPAGLVCVQAELSLTIPMSGYFGSIAFDVKISSELGHDKLHFFVGRNEQKTSGSAGTAAQRCGRSSFGPRIDVSILGAFQTPWDAWRSGYDLV